MLKSYDASEIAAVMGMRFVKESEATRAQQPRAPTRGAYRAAVKQGTFPERSERCSWRLVVQSDNLADRATPNTSIVVTSVDCIEPSANTMLKAIESGLPRESLRCLALQIAGGNEAEAKRLERLVVAKTMLGRRNDRLSRQEGERTERIARLFVQAKKALGTQEEASEFMMTPHPELDGETPLQAAQTDLGARRVEDILNSLEYGLAR